MEENGNVSNRRGSAYTDLAVNTTMLSFAKKLPLEELSMIGHGVESLSPKQNVMDCLRDEDTAYSQRKAPAPHPLRPLHSSWSFVRHNDATDEQRSFSCELPQLSSRTVTLSSTSRTSTWSFACRSARRVEREHEGRDESDMESSFGSLDGWGVSSTPEQQEINPIPDSRRHKHDSFMSDKDFDALPEWSDVEDESEYNEPFQRDSDVWSVTTAGSSSGGADAFVVPDMHFSTGFSESHTQTWRGAVFTVAETTRAPYESSDDENPTKGMKLMEG